MQRKEPREVEVYFDEVVSETEGAYEFRIEKESHWIPKSQILDSDMVNGVLVVPEWLAKDRGFV